MSYQTIQELNELVRVEKQRTTLARKGDFSSLRRTYRVAHVKTNGNTGDFWDHRFDVERDETHIHYVERDRNQTAYRWLLELLRPGSRVLNVGCGNGKFESFFDFSRFSGVSYEGIDIAKKSIRQLGKKYSQFHFWVSDITTEQLKHTFDVLCVFEVLEHISAAKVLSVLMKLYAATEKGGYIMVAVPLNEPLLEMFPLNPNEHVRLYSKEVICAELEIVGFRVVKTQEFIAFPTYYWLKKLLSKTLLPNRWKSNDLLVLAQKV